VKRLSYQELCEEVVRLREMLRVTEAQHGGDGNKEPNSPREFGDTEEGSGGSGIS
jgi:hypothetical protein